MKKFGMICGLVLLITACSHKNYNAFRSVAIKQVYTDTISIRALSVSNDNIWFSGNNGKVGSIDLASNKIIKYQIKKDSILPEFRSIALTSQAIFILSVANPALLYKINKNTEEITLVYQENSEKVFYDSMQFLDDEFGIAMGDPVLDCLNVIITEDGGANWKKIPCENLPKTDEGEAAFAASNTNLILRGNSIFMVSGGKKSRCFVSKDKGNSWQVYDTPIVQGKSMTGIFTADFYNEKIGFASGGNYENLTDNASNKAITKNGGKTWQLVANNEAFGYASCVQFIPNSDGKGLISVGPSGVYLSNNSGKNWLKINDISDLYTIRFLNENTAYAAGKNKIVRLDFMK